MLQCICLVTDHRNVVGIPVSLDCHLVCHFVFLSRFEVICDLLTEQTHSNMESMCGSQFMFPFPDEK